MRDNKNQGFLRSLRDTGVSQREIEVKILEIDVDDIRKKLRNLGAKKFFEGEIEMVKMDFGDSRLDKQGKLLRIRKAGDRVELCFKEKKEESKFKINEETEVITEDYEKTIKIFEGIGLKKVKAGKKYRECYAIGKVKFDIDTYEGIPTYLEIEAPSEKEVEEYVKKLGLTIEQANNMTAPQVFEHYGRRTDNC